MLHILSNNYLLMLRTHALYSIEIRNIIMGEIVTIITTPLKESDNLNSTSMNKTFFMSYISDL